MNHESSSALPAAIRVRGARVHNLKNIDVDVPLHKICLLYTSGGSLVQDHHAGLVADGAGKAEQLPLSGGEVVAALTHLFVQPVVQLVDELVGVLSLIHICSAWVYWNTTEER